MVAINAAVWMAVAFLGSTLLARSHGWIREWAEPVRSEIPSWVQVGLALPSSEVLPDYRLEVEPRVLRAARLLAPKRPEAQEDHYWFPAALVDASGRYRVEAQLVPNDGLRLRFKNRATPRGLRGLEIRAADEQRDARIIAAQEAARDLGLIAAPNGFARLSVNGSLPSLVFWTESYSEAMLERLGYPSGEIFRSGVRSSRDRIHTSLPASYVALVDPGSPDRVTSANVTALVELMHGSDAAAFAREVGERIDVDKLLAWSALTQLFAPRGPAAPKREPVPDWFFDRVSGLFQPVWRDPLIARTEQVAFDDGSLLVDRLLAIPRHRARYDGILRELVGADRSSVLARADDQTGQHLARIAASLPWTERAAALPQLARLRQKLRGSLATNAFAIRTQLASPVPSGVGGDEDWLASEATELPAPDRLVRSGVTLHVRGDEWVLRAGRHVLGETLVVPSTRRLVLEPGVELSLAPKASIVTFRGLHAVGTRQAPIEIRAVDPERPWGSIGVARAPETSELAYLNVSGGSESKYDGIVFSGSLGFNASDVVIRDSDIHDSHGDDAVSVKRGFFQIARSRFIDNASDGLDAEWSSGAIEESLFANNGDDGLDVATSEVRVHRAWFRRMGDKAISAGERSKVTVADSQIFDSQIAIASKEDSRVEVRGTEFRRNEIGISLYRDKPVFGAASTVVTGGLFTENVRDFAVETGSGLTLNGVERRANDPDELVVGFRASDEAASSAIP